MASARSPAWSWAGCLTEAGAVRLVTQRAALLAVPSAEPTALVCVDAGGPESEALCAASGLVIAAYNGPRCHVLAGPAAAVRDLAERLAEDGVPARLLDSAHRAVLPRDGRPGSRRCAAWCGSFRSARPPAG